MDDSTIEGYLAVSCEQVDTLAVYGILDCCRNKSFDILYGNGIFEMHIRATLPKESAERFVSSIIVHFRHADLNALFLLDDVQFARYVHGSSQN